MSIFQSDSDGTIQSNADDGVAHQAPAPEDPCVGCCEGNACEVCGAECVQLNFTDWIGDSIGASGAIVVDPITYLNGKDFKLAKSGTTSSCFYFLDCEINELIEIEPGLTVHYQRLLLIVWLWWDDDDKLNAVFVGTLFDDDFGTGANDRNIYLRSPSFDAPAIAEVANDCYEEIEYQVPGEEPEDPSPFPDAFAYIQVLEGVGAEDCTTEGCTAPSCADCCPDTTCIHLHVTRDAFTFPPTPAITFAATDFDLYLIRGYDANGDGTCTYSGQCIIRDESEVQIGVTYGTAHVVCTDGGTPVILELALHYNLADAGTGPRLEIYTLQTDGGATPVTIGCTSTTGISGDLKHYASIGGSYVEITGAITTADLTTDESCDTPADCTDEWEYRQARLCADDSLADVWMLAGLATGYPAFAIAGICYYFDFDDATSAEPGTVVQPDDIDATYANCDACGCPDECVECGACDPMCMVDATLTLHCQLLSGECSFCDNEGPTNDCGHCCDCDGICATGSGCPGPGCDIILDPGCASCECFSFFNRADCEGNGHDWYCDPDCVAGSGEPTWEISPCSRIDLEGDVTLDFDSFTANEIHFSATLMFGTDVLVFDVWFDCVTERWYAELTYNTRCIFTGDVNGNCTDFTTIVLGLEDTEIPDYPCTAAATLTDGLVELAGYACPA